MKICNYCSLENDDSAVKCASCGALAFSNKCNNCATTFSSSYCPNCGVKAGARPSICPDCGAKYFSAACPRCGYSPAREAAERSQHQTVVIHREQVETIPPKKRNSFGIVLLWLLFFPIMVFVAIWRAPRMSLFWKVALTVLIFSFFAYTYYSGS